MNLDRNWMIVILVVLFFFGIGGLQQCHYDNQKAMKRIEKDCK